MTTETDLPRVRMATASPQDDGIRVKFLTLEGPEVHFLLDDLAVGLLGMTLGAAMDARKAQIEAGGDEAVRIYKKEQQ